MKYFLSIENNNYCRWQAELLIESAQIIGIDKDLIIAVAESENSGNLYFHNLNKHKNKFLHHNVSEAYGGLDANKFFGLIMATEKKMLDDEFAIIHPDMLFLKPLENQDANISFHPDGDPEIDRLTNFRTSLRISEPWLAEMGSVIVLKDIPDKFFNNLLGSYKKLSEENFGHYQQGRASWLAASINAGVNLRFASKMMEMSMLHPQNMPIIHYRHGFSPYFNKRQFGDKMNLIPLNPFEAIVSENPTSVTQKVHEIVRSYQNKTAQV